MAEKVTIGNCELWHGDCREVLPLLPPVDLILTDPPYGIGADAAANRSGELAEKQAAMGSAGNKSGRGWKNYGIEGWDKERPAPWLFGLMQEKGKECVIWGGNYFTDLLPPSMRWLVWDKGQRNFSLADCEFAWSSQQQASRVLTLPRGEALQDGKEHPTQKPLRLMLWCLDMHPKAATVCDPFMGTGTTGVACVNLGKAFVGIERERQYFDAACRRIEQAYAQPRLFEDAKVGAGDTAVQGDMLLPANPPSSAAPKASAAT
ncbi:MAG: site-specific DNA-methyltransferase [Candidatus Accumulibacter sp.]|uniref:DNA-methyltransferase n=1 Tax=Accumulibacter sp. TaxID=2053492 RepID=UPI0025890749|nr:DNA methyltransferase [Accumulibacter sp.]MBK8113462.1 site-specific DNA-methyltransferase [Accumulibacter sp.]